MVRPDRGRTHSACKLQNVTMDRSEREVINNVTKNQLSVGFTLSVFKQQVPDAPSCVGVDPSSRFIQNHNF